MSETEIKSFCANLEASLLDALAKGIPVCVSSKQDTEQIQWNDISPIDYIYHGQVIKIKLGRPAAKQLAKDNYKKLKCSPGAKIGELNG